MVLSSSTTRCRAGVFKGIKNGSDGPNELTTSLGVERLKVRDERREMIFNPNDSARSNDCRLSIGSLRWTGECVDQHLDRRRVRLLLPLLDPIDRRPFHTARPGQLGQAPFLALP